MAIAYIPYHTIPYRTYYTIARTLIENTLTSVFACLIKKRTRSVFFMFSKKKTIQAIYFLIQTEVSQKRPPESDIIPMTRINISQYKNVYMKHPLLILFFTSDFNIGNRGRNKKSGA